METESVIKRFDVNLTWHKGFKRKISEIDEIVIHATPGQQASALLNWIRNGERKKKYKRGVALFHFLIGRLGEIYQLAPLNRWYYHSCSGKHDKQTIGIELLNPKLLNKGDFTERQYVSLEALVFKMLFPAIPQIKRIVSHDYLYNTYSGIRKSCPGPNFDWAKVRDMFKSRSISMKSRVFEDMIEFHLPEETWPRKNEKEK